MIDETRVWGFWGLNDFQYLDSGEGFEVWVVVGLSFGLMGKVVIVLICSG